MKNIVKSLFILLGTIAVSCSTDDVQDRPIIQGVDAPVLSAPEEGNIYVLLPENMTQQAERFVWSKANYNGDVAISYSLEIDNNGGDFSAAQVLGGTSGALQSSISTETLNTACLALGAAPYTAANFDVRVISSANGYSPMVSNIVTITVTPYSTDLPKIGVVGNHQGWSPATAPELAASGFGATDYEGYVWLDGEFKFIAANSSGVYEWGNTDWGDDGSFSGVLLQGSSTNCGPNAAGYYRVRANTTDLTYETTLVSWGVIGSATPGGWDSDTNMTYDSNTGKWSLVVTLVDGEIKFRYNDSWNNGSDQFNLGSYDGGADPGNYGGEMMTYGGGNIAVTAGTYLIELDLTSPRDYKYSITPQ
ncbi:MAG: SusE domain-containing protein [Flavobacterium sp.]|nr:SusE domain-containing protein [Flavobacterium sp.]